MALDVRWSAGTVQARPRRGIGLIMKRPVPRCTASARCRVSANARRQAEVKRPYRRNIARLRRTQGCLTDCVAYVLNIHPERVPYFVYPRQEWMQRLRRFFKRHGFAVFWTTCIEPPKRGMHIVCGDSLKWKTYAHVVVYRAGRLAFDPQYPSSWRDSRITHRLVMRQA